MSTPFTSIEQGDDWTEVAYLEELRTAYNERIKVIVDLASGLFLIPEIEVGNYAGFWLRQNFLTAIDGFFRTGRWVRDQDQTYDPTGDADIEVYDTSNMEDFFKDAGLWKNGSEWGLPWAEIYDSEVNDWTNLDDPMYTQNLVGGIQYDGGFTLFAQTFWMNDGHIDGPWVVDAMQKVVSLLHWTTQRFAGVAATSWYAKQKMIRDAWVTSSSGTCSIARQNCLDLYNSPAGQWANSNWFYRIQRRVTAGGGRFQCQRWRSTVFYAFSDSPNAPAFYTDTSPRSPYVEWKWQIWVKPDVALEHGWPLNVMTLFEEEASFLPITTKDFETALMGNHDTFPLDLSPSAPFTCPVSSAQFDIMDMKDKIYMILKWDFSIA